MVVKKKNSSKPYSLVSPKGMGGIYGGDGYTFQDRYIVCNIPKWIADSKFQKLMSEGTGDVDVVFSEKRSHFYDHIQVKDHLVTNAEFADVIKTFAEIDKGTNKVYRNFVLACPLVSKEIKSLNEKLNRYREGVKMYDAANKKALKTTEVELKKIFDKLKLTKYYKFVVSKVSFEINPIDFNDNAVCKRQFVATLTEHPRYKQKLLDILNPAYSHLISEVLAHRGKVLQGTKIHTLINDAIAGRKSIFKSNVIHVHNWTKEMYEPKANVTVDWSTYFDRQNRKVPDAITWNEKLIPGLYSVKNKISGKTTNRHILLRGKCALSTGIALGIVFPEIGNWTFELSQPPQPDAWRSDAQKIDDYKLSYKELNPSAMGMKSNGNEIAFVFNITGKALDEVANYFKAHSTPIKKIISIQPKNNPGNLSIQNDSEAVSLTSASKDILKEMIIKYKAVKTHLFFFGPIGLAIFLGQKLTSLGAIQLYEFQDPGYKPSCSIKS